MRNSYFVLRHGRNNHQTEKPDLVYGWPNEEPPCVLDLVGREQIKAAAEELAEENIDLIFSSDLLRTRQSAEIVAERLGIKEIHYDERLRDVNWGVFQGRTKKEAWEYYSHNMKEKFAKAVPEGESWNDCRDRMLACLEEIDSKHENRIILLVSHSDPLWLLEGALKGLNNQELLRSKENEIKVGEIRKLC